MSGSSLRPKKHWWAKASPLYYGALHLGLRSRIVHDLPR